MVSAQDYAWIEDVFDDAACVTVVVGLDTHEVLRAFGADPSASVSIADASEAAYDEDAAGDDLYVCLQTIPGAVLAVEFNGYQGSLEEVLAAASAGGKAASMFWNVEDDNAFSCAAGGRVLASVDMYDAEDPESVQLPSELVALFTPANSDGAGLHATGLAMVEQFTGVQVTREHIASLDRAYPITAGH
jgi:hypothetical protein